MNRMTVWTVAIVVCTDRIRHVGYMVRTVEILSVPAGWEENLGTHPVRALVREEVFSFSPRRVVYVSVLIIYSNVDL